MAKKANKKIIVTANLDHKTEAEKTAAYTKLQNGVATNSPTGFVANPTPANVLTVMNHRQGLFTTRTGLEGLLHQNTEDIRTDDTTLDNIFISQWANEIQNFPGITVNQIKGMNYGVKGVAGGAAETTSVMETGKTKESAPVIARIDTNIKGQHTIHEHNSITGKIGHPKKTVRRIDVYGQTGGNPPANLTDLIKNGGGWLGTIKRGKFINVYTVTTGTGGNKGLEEYYILVYIDKVTLKPAAQSKQDSAPIE